MNKICDECETVSHCTKHGCIPKVSAKDAMKLELEALEAMYDEGKRLGWHIHPKWSTGMDNAVKVITALREALAEQPAQQREPDLSGLKPSTQEVIKGWIEDGTFIQRAIGAMQEQEAENMRLEKMAAPQPAQQEPIYQYKLANGSWIDQTKESHDYNVRHGQATVRVVYTSPPAQQEPVAWIWDTKSQHDGFLDAHFQFSKPENSLRIMNLRPLYESPQPAQPQQEPFGYFKAEPFGWTDCAATDEGAVALYEHPPAQRKPLTFSKLCDIEYEITHTDGDFSILKFARAIEAAHGIKEKT